MVGVFALLIAIGYVGLGLWAIALVWGADPAGSPNEAATYVESALAGLVGGVVATAFGVSPPSKNLVGLSALSTAGLVQKTSLGAAYVIAYAVVGISATVTWLANSSDTSVVVKNLAVVFFGMIIPIVAGSLLGKGNPGLTATLPASGPKKESNV